MPPQAHIPVPTPADFATDFPDIAEGLRTTIDSITKAGGLRYGGDPKSAPASIPRQRNLGSESAQLERASRDLDERMEAQGWQPYTIISVLPFAFLPNGVMFSRDMTVPACQPGMEFAYLTLHRYEKDTRDRGNGVFVPEAWVPGQLVKDYISEARRNEWGGVFAYPGRALPNDPTLPPQVRDQLLENLANAKKEVRRWAQKKFREADNEWNRPNGDRRGIGEPHRAAYRWLLSQGFIKESDKPQWVEMTSEEASRMVSCPGCKSQVAPGTLVCPKCPYVFDPFNAYKNTLIGRDHNSLRRLSWEEIKRLKLDKYISRDELIELDETEEHVDSDEGATDVASDDTERMQAATAPRQQGNQKTAAKKKQQPKQNEAKSREQKAAEEGL